MKIYVVNASTGSYDDFYKYNVEGFLTEQAAKDFIAQQPEINYQALQELDELKWEYIELIDVVDYENWTEEQWELHNKLRDEAEEKATKEIQDKYPDADLTANPEFNGYGIEELEVEQ